jgi:hypothetical protein
MDLGGSRTIVSEVSNAMEPPMSDENYDDGLVHGHVWSQTHTHAETAHPIADVSGARIPSTAQHDDCIYCD